VNGAQSCASCHQRTKAFSDGKSVSAGAEGTNGTRNAMALFNLAWKSSFFWDGRAATLREQVLQPIQNPIEMHESLTNVVRKLRKQTATSADPDATSRETEYAALFERAFGSPEITSDRIARALEQFLIAQVSFGSKFDRVISGQASFSEEEQRGFELFHTEYDPGHGQYGADCFHCHGGPLFQSQSFANNGLDSRVKDAGRFLATGKEGDRGKFAVPSLRNVELTAPYMHDGRFATLEAAVEHYCTGMKRGSTLDPNLAKHPDGGVPLSTADQKALVAFLKTLTDECFRSVDR
jgi:cytochrome c peroxidase